MVDVLNAHGENYDRDCQEFYGCFCGWDNGTEDHNGGYATHLAQALEAAGYGSMHDAWDEGRAEGSRYPYNPPCNPYPPTEGAS